MDDDLPRFNLQVASSEHFRFADLIVATMAASARERGTGIGKRDAGKIRQYIAEGNAVIATLENGDWAGFCYLAPWDNGLFVSASGLIVSPDYRTHGIAKSMKIMLLGLAASKFPSAIIVGITTSKSVMKINTSLGFYPTAFSEMPKDPEFWNGCKHCVNHDILQRTKGRFCLCTAMRLEQKQPIVTG